MSNVKSLPCPLCGSEEIIINMWHSRYYEVKCTNPSCDTYLSNELYFNQLGESDIFFTSYEEAVNAWNKFAKEPVQIIDDSTFKSHRDFSGATYCEWIDKNEDVIARLTIADSCLGGICVANLKVYEKYRGKGLSYKILDCAVKKFGATDLAVEKTNHIAKHIYDKYGFKVVDEDDDMCYMTYTEH